MIDTDKYEGHALSLESVLSGYFTIEQIKKVDKTLMEDAPLLLAEVKRLREKLNAKIALITDVDTMIGDKWNVTQDDWNELVNKHYGDDEE